MKNREQPVIWTEDHSPFLRGYELQGIHTELSYLELGRAAIAHEEAMAIGEVYRGEQAALEANGTNVRLISGAHLLVPDLIDLLITPRMISLAEAVLGTGVYIHQFRLHYKPAFWGGDFFWHSDFTIWHWLDGMMDPRCVHFLVPLDEMRHENGPLLVSPGTHLYHDESLWDKEKQQGRSIRQERDNPKRLQNGFVSNEQLHLVEALGVKPITGRPGDLTFMDVNMMHSSTANFSPWGRLTASIALNSLDNKLQEPPCGKGKRANWVSSRDYNKL